MSGNRQQVDARREPQRERTQKRTLQIRAQRISRGPFAGNLSKRGVLFAGKRERIVVIVEDVRDAIAFLLRSHLDVLYIEGFRVQRK